MTKSRASRKKQAKRNRRVVSKGQRRFEQTMQSALGSYMDGDFLSVVEDAYDVLGADAVDRILAEEGEAVAKERMAGGVLVIDDEFSRCLTRRIELRLMEATADQMHDHYSALVASLLN